MLTGDNARIAANVAREAGIDEARAQLLPEDKAAIVKRLKEKGGVIMVGDGINDTPALGCADVGVAMRGGADIARETADVTLAGNRLSALVDLRRLGVGTMNKIYRNFAFIVSVNSLLLVLGLGGAISPAASALLHNAATVASGVYGLKSVLPRAGEDEGEE
jgi:P-type E1-E2 ATPase